VRHSNYVKSLAYVLLLNVSLVLTVVVFHEMGHAAAGMAYGCGDIRIVVYEAETSNTYTQMNCSFDAPIQPLAMAGWLLIVPYALLFYLLALPERNFWLVVVGFNFMISSSDLGLVVLPAIVPLFMVLGASLVLYGEFRFIDKAIYTVKPKYRA
jgi:hypothetical protein